MSAKLVIEEGAKKATKSSKRLPIEEFFTRLEDKLAEQEEQGEGEENGKGKIWHILKAYTAGYEAKEIARYGRDTNSWSPVTVYRQTREYKNLREKPATHYQGFEVFESRVARLIARKGMTREQAVEHIYEKDLESSEKGAE